jgi:hypothetical protein
MNWGSGDNSVIGVYSDARTEYSKQLCVFLVPAYFQFFLKLLEKSKSTAEPKKFLWQFQTYLNEIPEWNMEKVSNEIATLQSNCGCDYLEDLLTAVFIAHTKVLTAIRVNAKQKKVQINVPKVEHFLYKVLCECSKLLWGSTYLFSDGISSIEKQKNYRNVEQLLAEGISQAIRAMVPVKSILRDFVNQDEDEAEEEEKEEKEEKDSESHESIAEALMGKKSEEKSVEEKPVEEKSTEDKPIEDKPIEDKSVEDKSVEDQPIVEQPKNEVVSPPPTIVIDTNNKRSVSFSEFDTVLDQDNPEESDLYEQKPYNEPELEILDEVGVPLDDDDSVIEDLDKESVSSDEDKDQPIGSDEYDVLV